MAKAIREINKNYEDIVAVIGDGQSDKIKSLVFYFVDKSTYNSLRF